MTYSTVGHKPNHAEALVQVPRSLECFETNDPDLIMQARQLTAREYLKRAFITPNQLDENNVLSQEFDPYHNHAKYYVVVNEQDKVVATARKIYYDETRGEDSFPLFDHETSLQRNDVEEIKKHGLENVVEISALVRDKSLDVDGTASMRIYKELFLDQLKENTRGNAVFIMACNPVLFKTFNTLFNGAMKRIGPDLAYPGQEAIPVMFPNLEGAVELINKSAERSNPSRFLHRQVVRYFFQYAELANVNVGIAESLKANGYGDVVKAMETGDWQGQDMSPEEAMQKIKIRAVYSKIAEKLAKRKPEVVANVALLGYTALRTTGVAQGIDPVANTDWREFLFIEVATQVPYTWGISDLLRGGLKDSYSRARKGVASIAVGSAFVAPYAYLIAHGAGEDLQGKLVAGSMLGAGAYFLSGKVKLLNKMRQSKKQESSSNPEQK